MMIGGISRAMLPAVLAVVLGIGGGAARLYADSVRQELFEFGFAMGRPGTLNIPDNAVLGQTGPIMSNIRLYLEQATTRGRNLEIPVESIRQLLRDAPTMTRAAYEDFGPQSPGRRRLVMDEHQAVIEDRWGDEGARIYALGIWTAGAVDLCVSNQGMRRDQRPGAYSLLMRNTGWMQQMAPVLGLSTSRIDSLVRDLPNGGGFGFAQETLDKIRNDWSSELLRQPELPTTTGGGVIAVTAANWNDVVRDSTLPVVVVFGQSWSPQTARQMRIIEQMAERLAGQVVFATVDLDQSPDLLRRERIDGVPTVRVYRGGRPSASRGGVQNEASIEEMLRASGQSQRPGGGLLGIEQEGSVQRMN